MGSRSIVYVGLYALILQHTILSKRVISHDRRHLKIEKYCPGLKVRFPDYTGISERKGKRATILLIKRLKIKMCKRNKSYITYLHIVLELNLTGTIAED